MTYIINPRTVSEVRVSPYDIEVSVVNGVVYLKGTVETSFEKSQAGRVAAGVYGVIQVINDLKVKNEPQSTTNL
jgi:osmotically-inducible protein OsmY